MNQSRYALFSSSQSPPLSSLSSVTYIDIALYSLESVFTYFFFQKSDITMHLHEAERTRAFFLQIPRQNPHFDYRQTYTCTCNYLGDLRSIIFLRN